jgi:hypothetical protein
MGRYSDNADARQQALDKALSGDTEGLLDAFDNHVGYERSGRRPGVRKIRFDDEGRLYTQDSE